MSTYRCYGCGFETEDRGRFVDTQTNGDYHWMHFICPQCRHENPSVAEVDEDPYCKIAYEYPKWTVVETGHGLCHRAHSKKGSTCTMPMISDHPLWKAPASLLRAGLTGSMADHNRWLVGQGKARSEAFKADSDRIHADFSGKLPPMTPHEAYREHPVTREMLAEIDEARKQHGVGPHEERIEHDGPALMRKANPRWAA